MSLFETCGALSTVGCRHDSDVVCSCFRTVGHKGQCSCTHCGTKFFPKPLPEAPHEPETPHHEEPGKVRKVSLSTRRERVLGVLSMKANHWVDGSDLTDPEVGGSEGLRRLRELRSEGHMIRKRRKPGGDGFQYRILDIP